MKYDHPILRELAWQKDAACGGFGHIWEEMSTSSQIETCHTCPVMGQCREYGTRTDASGVVYGGVKFAKHSRAALMEIPHAS